MWSTLSISFHYCGKCIEHIDVESGRVWHFLGFLSRQKYNEGDKFTTHWWHHVHSKRLNMHPRQRSPLRVQCAHNQKHASKRSKEQLMVHFYLIKYDPKFNSNNKKKYSRF